jgi:hypothetical protein
MELPNNEESINLYNNTSQEKLSGLSPSQTFEIIHNPLGEKSPIKFRDGINNETLNKIPFFKITEEFLKIVQRDKFIKLTPLGALPKKIMVELYAYKFIPEDFIESGITKLWKEDDSISIKSAKIVCELAKLTKKVNGKILLTKNGEKFLKQESRLFLFKQIYLTFTESFNWSFNDGFVEEPVGQYGSLFSIYLLLKYGESEKKTLFYSEKYLSVFFNFLPLFVDDYATPEEQFNNCYSVRTFERFTNWFGLTYISEPKNNYDNKNNKIKSTELLTKLFIME